MTPQEAISVLDQATQPGVRLSRSDYLKIDQALGVLDALVKATPAVVAEH